MQIPGILLDTSLVTLVAPPTLLWQQIRLSAVTLHPVPCIHQLCKTNHCADEPIPKDAIDLHSWLQHKGYRCCTVDKTSTQQYITAKHILNALQFHVLMPCAYGYLRLHGVTYKRKIMQRQITKFQGSLQLQCMLWLPHNGLQGRCLP